MVSAKCHAQSSCYLTSTAESLFSSTSSPQRKYWGFQVFQRALTRVTEVNMPMLFTKNFMRSWINHLSKRDRYLHKIAQQTVRVFCQPMFLIPKLWSLGDRSPRIRQG